MFIPHTQPDVTMTTATKIPAVPNIAGLWRDGAEADWVKAMPALGRQTLQRLTSVTQLTTDLFDDSMSEIDLLLVEKLGRWLAQADPAGQVLLDRLTQHRKDIAELLTETKTRLTKHNHVKTIRINPGIIINNKLKVEHTRLDWEGLSSSRVACASKILPGRELHENPTWRLTFLLILTGEPETLKAWNTWCKRKLNSSASFPLHDNLATPAKKATAETATLLHLAHISKTPQVEASRIFAETSVKKIHDIHRLQYQTREACEKLHMEVTEVTKIKVEQAPLEWGLASEALNKRKDAQRRNMGYYWLCKILPSLLLNEAPDLSEWPAKQFTPQYPELWLESYQLPWVKPAQRVWEVRKSLAGHTQNILENLMLDTYSAIRRKDIPKVQTPGRYVSNSPIGRTDYYKLDELFTLYTKALRQNVERSTTDNEKEIYQHQLDSITGMQAIFHWCWQYQIEYSRAGQPGYFGAIPAGIPLKQLDLPINQEVLRAGACFLDALIHSNPNKHTPQYCWKDAIQSQTIIGQPPDSHVLNVRYAHGFHPNHDIQRATTNIMERTMTKSGASWPSIKSAESMATFLLFLAPNLPKDAPEKTEALFAATDTISADGNTISEKTFIKLLNASLHQTASTWVPNAHLVAKKTRPRL